MKEPAEYIAQYYAERAAACGLPEEALPLVLREPVPLLSGDSYISFNRPNKEIDEAALKAYKETIQSVGTFAVGCTYQEWPVTVGKGRQKAVRHITDLLDPQPNKSVRNAQGRTGQARNLALHALRPSDIPEGMIPETNCQHWPLYDGASLETGAVLLALTGEHTRNGRFQHAVGRLILVTANNVGSRTEATQHITNFRSFTTANPEFGDQLLRLRVPEAGIVSAV